MSEQPLLISGSDYRQRAAILRVLLNGSIGLSVMALGIITLAPLLMHRSAEPAGIGATALVSAFFIGLQLLSRRGSMLTAAYLFCLVYLLTGTFMLLTWGILVPQGLLLFVLAIVSSSILIESRAGILFTLVSCGILLLIERLHAAGVHSPDLSWAAHPGAISDVIVFTGTFMVLMVTSWLSNREIERSFNRASTAERELKRERDGLEATVEERTAELRQRQQAEIQQLYELAYFGRVTASLMHDLANPLSAVALTLRRLESSESSRLVKRALENTKRIEQFIESARLQLQHSRHSTEFILADETRQVLDLFADELRANKIAISHDLDEKSKVTADPARYSRLLSNLLSNAIDACKAQKSGRSIAVGLRPFGSGWLLTVTDNGVGIPAALLDKVFDPFFTTKADGEGTGIGLSICKEIVEQDFNGEVRAISTPREGTTMEAYLFCHPA